jgi:hypothetical protein
VQWSQTAATGKVKVRETDINGCSGDASEVLVNLATNAIEKTGIEGLRLYPNPTSQLLYIQSYSDITWMLYDMSGKEILSGHNRAGNIQEIDIEAFTAGLYTIRISDGQHTVNTQIIKN